MIFYFLVLFDATLCFTSEVENSVAKIYLNDPQDSCHCMDWCPKAPVERRDALIPSSYLYKRMKLMIITEINGWVGYVVAEDTWQRSLILCFQCRISILYISSMSTMFPLHLNLHPGTSLLSVYPCRIPNPPLQLWFCSRQAASDLTYLIFFLYLVLYIYILRVDPHQTLEPGVDAQAGSAQCCPSCLHVSQYQNSPLKKIK